MVSTKLSFECMYRIELQNIRVIANEGKSVDEPPPKWLYTHSQSIKSKYTFDVHEVV